LKRGQQTGGVFARSLGAMGLRAPEDRRATDALQLKPGLESASPP
jgi:hypothetical protein